MRFASLRAGLRQIGGGFFFYFPGLRADASLSVLHPGLTSITPPVFRQDAKPVAFELHVLLHAGNIELHSDWLACRHSGEVNAFEGARRFQNNSMTAAWPGAAAIRLSHVINGEASFSASPI
jgi:hypothetical protein